MAATIPPTPIPNGIGTSFQTEDVAPTNTPHPRLAALVVVEAQVGHVGAEQPLGLGDDQGQDPVGVGADVSQLLGALHERALLLMAGAQPVHEVPELESELVLGVPLLALDRGRGVRRRVAQHLVVPGQRRLVHEEPEVTGPLHHLVAPIVASSPCCCRR